MTTVVWGLAACDACRRAVRALRAAGQEAALRDVRADPLDAPEIARVLEAIGPEAVNRRSATWRGLTEAERAAPPAMLLAAHPTLMKRPVLSRDGRLYPGWGPSARPAPGP